MVRVLRQIEATSGAANGKTQKQTKNMFEVLFLSRRSAPESSPFPRRVLRNLLPFTLPSLEPVKTSLMESGGLCTMRVRKKTVRAKKEPKRPAYALKVKVEGPGVHRKSIPIPELLKICAALQSAVHRQAEAMERPAVTTLRRGPITANAQDECTLELSGIVAGSTGLLFRYAKPQQHLPIADVTFGSEVLSRVASTLRDFEKNKELPGEIDSGVLASLQELGTALERRSITKISLSVPGHDGRKGAIKAVYTPAVRERIAARIKAPMQEPMSIEGKLEMADFKEAGRICRIHPTVGVPVQCSFDPSKEEEIYQALRRPARVTGVARVNPHSGKVEEIKIEKIEILDELMLGARNFTAGHSLEQLAEMQGVQPLKRPDDLAGGWPIDENIDEFIDATYGSRN